MTMTMKVWINNNIKEISKKTAKIVREKLTEAGFEFDKQEPDIAISIGGDGTFLSTFHEYSHRLSEMKFLGIHTGHLGFYADWRDYEIDELIEALKSYQGATFSYPLLEAEIEFNDGKKDSFYALNEAIIKRPSKTMRADVFLDGEFFERFRGDGLTFSTPSGSTAYAKSIGGAVIHPKAKVMQMNEIAPINNRVYRSISAPIIVPSSQEVLIVPAEEDDYIVSYDTNSQTNKSVKAVKYRIAEQEIQFVKLRDRHFWGRVEHAFLGTNDFE